MWKSARPPGDPGSTERKCQRLRHVVQVARQRPRIGDQIGSQHGLVKLRRETRNAARTIVRTALRVAHSPQTTGELLRKLDQRFHRDTIGFGLEIHHQPMSEDRLGDGAHIVQIGHGATIHRRTRFGAKHQVL